MVGKRDDSRSFPIVTNSDRAPNVELAAKSLDVDTPADLNWFHAHPGARVRRRGPTELEMRAFDLPANARVVVALDPFGKCWRSFRH